ncbi:NERD domain-containing protein [Candidatus Neomarinimicrobiota bacterium]
MSFYRWTGLDSEFPHEIEQLKNISKIVQDWSHKTNTNVHLLSNFFVNGEEIDVAIILPNKVLIVDLKSGSGVIKGDENGPWICIPRTNLKYIINKGSKKNPLNQARDKRFAMMQYLDERKGIIFSAQKASQISFEHISSLIVFDNDITWDKGQLPHVITLWFDVLSMNELPSNLSNARSKKLSLTEEEAEKIPSLMNLRKVPVINSRLMISILKNARKKIITPPYPDYPDAVIELLHKQGIEITVKEAIGLIEKYSTGTSRDDDQEVEEDPPIDIDIKGLNGKNKIYEYSVRNAHAKLKIMDGKYFILKGSTAVINNQKSMRRKAKEVKDNLIREGILFLKSNKQLLEFSEDVPLNSPSLASCIVSGTSTNGKKCFKIN